MIHYHGTSIGRNEDLLRLVGRNFCVSHARPAQVALCHEIGQSVMLDNGAWSAFRNGRTVEWARYYAWCDSWLNYPTTWAVIPDVIDGDEPANDALIAEWPHGQRGAPVWHLNESLERLERLCIEWPLVCLGSSGAYRVVASPSWHARMITVMDAVCDERGRPRARLHMLRGLQLADGPYPFYSADSTMIAQKFPGRNNRRKAREDVVRIADSIDGLQPAPLWHRPAEQLTMGVASSVG